MNRTTGMQPGAATAQPRSRLPLAAAVVLGVLLASMSVFGAFLVFNVILHWGA